jgi:hypothetical protein
MSYKIGTKVKIIPNSIFYYQSNGAVGVIVDLPAHSNFPFVVSWKHESGIHSNNVYSTQDIYPVCPVLEAFYDL